MKVLLCHAWIAAQCHWEYFHKGGWWDICMNVLLDPSKYWLGEKLEKEKKTLTIRVAQWIFRSMRAEPNVDSEDASNAYSRFKSDMKKYFDMGKANKQYRYVCRPVPSR